MGTKYSEKFGATYIDENGQENLIFMGCYGIGVGRTMAASVEQNHDERGIIWPVAIAPFEVIIITASKDEKQMEIAEQLYQSLLKGGIDVILDDRDERAGVKFADADLIGYPYRITVGKKTILENTVDLKTRVSGLEQAVPLTEVVEKVSQLIKANK